MNVQLPWKSWLILGAIVVVLIWFWNREGNLRRDAERQREAAELALKDQVVANEVNRRALQGSVDDLLSKNDLLREAYESALQAAPGAKPTGIAQLDTGPVKVVHRPQQSAASTQPPPVTFPPSSPGAAGSTCEPCAVTFNDRLSIEVDEITLESKGGNTIVAGAATVYILDPVKAQLAQGRFSSHLSTAEKLEAPPPPRWGFRASVAWMPQGRVQGGGVLLPPLSFLGLRLEPSAFVLGGATTVGGFDLGVRF